MLLSVTPAFGPSEGLGVLVLPISDLVVSVLVVAVSVLTPPTGPEEEGGRLATILAVRGVTS